MSEQLSVTLQDTVLDHFLRSAQQTPEAVAVVFDQTRLTYRELDAAANALAARLWAAGVRSGGLVGVHMGRSAELVVAVLGILRAGAAYLPLDPSYPTERIAFIAADAAAPVMVTRYGEESPLPGKVVTVDLAELLRTPDLPPPQENGDLAYVIYTSGSTGQPKGVEIGHRALANLIGSFSAELGASPADRWLGLTSLSFDIAALEIFLPLTSGGRLVMAPDTAVRDGRALARMIRDQAVTHVQATPSSWRLLVPELGGEPTLVALCGGEPLPVPLAKEIRVRVRRLLNVYGPTETTVWSTVDDLPADPDTVTIGRPIANTDLYVLDESLAAVPAGSPGELFIGGAGLAAGYHNQPELTATRFVSNPYGPGRIYRTGDLARIRADGRLDFLGRLDDQVKIRGHRIELGEIEARLLSHPTVAEAAVAAVGEEDPQLVGYVVAAAGSTVDSAVLSDHLSRSLPAVMVPNAYVWLGSLPLTPNGKLDRSALPAPPRTRDVEAAPAYTGVAAQVQEVWCEVLRIDDIGPNEDLFDLGGHSLTMTKIIARLRSRLGVEVPLDVFFDTPTISGVVAAVVGLQQEMAE
ncbi:non-ribosomal peptide synthetase [Fodinicola feengrottensis]|uniref:Carrier domain-containing protein n=1 Tax=Fodinicola feengrottensis TaxID=435914 RepID=A0ABN2IKX6_9ACTN|nr:non-ribosomal peptide synthetase [Fodinicola feengrottensis]